MLKHIFSRWFLPTLCLTFTATSYAEMYSDSWQDDALSSMSNEELQAAAQAKRSSEMSHTQQALNYQWMAQHANESGPKRSNKALKKMFKKHFKQYWMERTEKKTHRLSQQSKSSKTNYGLKMSGDTVKLAFEHRFF